MNVDNLLATALNEANTKKIDYLEARWGNYCNQFLHARDSIVDMMNDESSAGMNVRIFHKGAWGFAAAMVKTAADVANLVEQAQKAASTSARISNKPLILTDLKPYQAQWQTPIQIDPFKVPLKEKLDLLQELNRLMLAHNQISEVSSWMRFFKTEKKYVNTIGTRTDQIIFRSDADYRATAVGNDRCESRSYQSIQLSAGYESVDAKAMLEAAPRVAREAIEQLTAKPWSKDHADLILMPSHTRLVIHETIGHATELDRILGWEADYAGTSFATPEKLDNYRYGSNCFNVTADRTMPHGLATCGFDDEGVQTGRWKIVTDGILTGYATTRDTAPMIDAKSSCGCAYADHWTSFPILRMANTSIDPGPKGSPTFKQLIENTENGILVDGMAAFSIDQQRINFQFGGDYCRAVRNGRIEEPLWNVVYEGNNPSFWSSMDAVCCSNEWRQYGVYGCAKGQPVQTTALTHGSAPLRLRNVSVRRSS